MFIEFLKDIRTCEPPKIRWTSAAHEHSQPDALPASSVEIGYLLDERLMVGNAIMEVELATGTLSHWMRCNNESCHFKSLLCESMVFIRGAGPGGSTTLW
ncbi:hypothetical protein EVAR_27086_1 [Eumeta japonica]|uniref:Uncharacterized protein n=1 Tax=Eumeta variegata TaxID=151549 RepID=A0A4C1VJF9_EUMVA|nr:hypothetical protein EVAR_27086_1 [Eumeta japonica]